MIEVLLPDIGDFHDVEIIEILVKPGDRIAVEDPLITLESDKASIEIPSPVEGVVSALKVAVGDRVNEGSLILLLEAGAGTVDAPGVQAAGPESAPVEIDIADAEPHPESPVVAEVDVASAAQQDPVVVYLPDIGDFHDVEIIEILVAVGDLVAADQSLLTLESDKATMEIPAPFAGRVESIEVRVGEKINRGQQIVTMRQTRVAVAPPAASSAEPPGGAAVPQATESAPLDTARPAGEKELTRRPVVARPSDAPRGRSHASPGVRRFARELGVDLAKVPGSALKGRITKEDVQAYVKRALSDAMPPPVAATAGGLALPAMPVVDFAKFGAVEEVDLGRIKRLSGAHLQRSWLNVPHVTQFDAADITDLETFRKGQKEEAARANVRLTFMPFLIKAVCKALAIYPQFNSALSPDGERLILKRYMHIGVAVDTPNGLVVPVLRDADRKGVFELARELGDLSAKARDGKLSPGDMQGGCLSISSLGGIGGTQFTPIVNAPEVAILGVSRAAMQPVWDGQSFVPRLMMPFSLSYDHRVIDGAEGVRFTTLLGQLLGDIRRLLL